ncbi:MAG: hypothetical protein ACT4RN_21450 [Pseudonocardia sp.]
MTTTDRTIPIRSTFATHRAAEVRRFTIAATLVCGLACLAALVPAVEHAANLTAAGLLVGAALVLAVRLGLRTVRERREDHADALTAARWRAEYAPHLLTPGDRARLAEIGHPTALAALTGREVA